MTKTGTGFKPELPRTAVQFRGLVVLFSARTPLQNNYHTFTHKTQQTIDIHSHAIFRMQNQRIKNVLHGYYPLSELNRQSGRHFSAKLVPTFAVRGVSRGQSNGSPWPLTSVFYTGAATFPFS
jgi:hypothetical protein